MIDQPVVPAVGETWRITWPTHMVMENGVIVGYTMPRLGGEQQSWTSIIDYYNRKLAEGHDVRIADRVRIARNLALGFRAVHTAGYVIGDVNEKSIEVNRQNDIALLDCDSYGFTDPVTRRTLSSNQVGRPEFQPPEAQIEGGYANRTQNHDCFGLAVLVFQLLTGFHPYTVTHQPDHPQHRDRILDGLFPPARSDITTTDEYRQAWERLTSLQKERFLHCFSKQDYGKPRPTPDHWLEALQEMPQALPAQPRQPPQPLVPRSQPGDAIHLPEPDYLDF
jgi:DNA-binding helix-hairpin-helix protein with protein kinase domain